MVPTTTTLVKLLNDLDRQGFSDDLLITVRENNDSILSKSMKNALNYVIG
jgi:hypothetical protein